MKLLRLLSAVLSVVVPIAGADAGQPGKERPNLIFILADDLGPGDLGCYGGKLAPTPNLERMAREGIRFTQYYAAAPICSPSRCGLITGQFPGRWKITSFLQTKAGNRACGQADFLDPAAPSLPRVLQQAGYRTIHIGKWHLGGGRDVSNAPRFAAYGYDEGIGTWESPEPHPDITATDWIWSDRDKVKRWDRTAFFVEKTLDFLRRHRGTPCFVNLWLDDPHTPWVPDAAAGKGASTAPNLKAVMVENDRQFGRLLKGLEELGIDRNTLVIFASDNGPLPTLQGRRSAGLRGCKLSLYEGGVRLPFIARWPGKIPAGATDATTVVAAVDLLPTFTALGGAKLSAGFQPDGEDRSAALFGTPTPARARPLFWEYGRNDKSFAYPPQASDRSPNLAMRDGSWKLLVNSDGRGAELYDLATDPGETHNRAADEPQVTERLRQLVLEWWKSLP